MTNLRKLLWSQPIQMGGKPGKPDGLRGGSADQSIASRTGGEAFRDLDSASRQDVKFRLLTAYEAIYTEPFYLKLDTEPTGGIMCLRCVDPVTDEPVNCGIGVHFIWDEANKQAAISSIDGLSAGFQSAIKRYKFTFLVVG